MKKLFTLFAFLACFLGANAIEITDRFVDFSKITDLNGYEGKGWFADEAVERLSLQNGYLHFHNEAATDPGWAVQFQPITIPDAEVGVIYTLHFKIKGTVQANCNMGGVGQNGWGIFPITTDWVEGTLDYECTDASSLAFMMQCGDYVGDWDIAYLKVTHEGKQEREPTWVDIINNGDAEKSWEELGLANVTADDLENNNKICFWTKEKGVNDNNPHPAEITEVDGGHAFICRATYADSEEVDQWGNKVSAWDNQIWIQSPRAWKVGEQFKLTFRYKASRNVKTDTQVHNQTPGSYLGGACIDQNVNFTTEWQTYDKVHTINSDGTWSICFNLNSVVLDATDFYVDDITWSEMKLDKGYFVAAKNTESGLVDYDFDNAIEMVFDEEMNAYVATVGSEDDDDSWVNELMISTVRGNDRQYKANTIKVKGTIDGDPENWLDTEDGSSYKITLPAQGVWTIYYDPEANVISFKEVKGEEIKVKEPIEINPNPTVITINGVERDWYAADDKGNAREKDADGNDIIGTGQGWDNQFIIMAKRPLAVGEETVISFKYKADKEATANTQCGGGEPGQYIHWSCIGDINFTTEEKEFNETFTVPADAKNMQSITFNMALLKAAVKYEIKDVIWKLADNTESLIDMEGDNNFYVKTGAGTSPEIPSGIVSIATEKAASNVLYNIAGQRVSNSYKGIVIKNGKKAVVK